MARLKTAAAAVWKVFVGALLCQTPITAVLVVGWTYRAMQRVALRRWARAAPSGDGALRPLPDRLDTGAFSEAWPNWMLTSRPMRARRRERSPETGRRAHIRNAIYAAFGSLGANVSIGLRGMINTWAVTLFPVTLWTVGWYAGWDNSFNKGYEQYYVGIILSWIGVVLFLLVMLYLPLAQARHAITGDWRAFYHVRTLCALIVRHPVRSLLLAVAYSLLSIPFLFFLALPVFLEQVFPQTSAMSDAELLAFLNRYYFRIAILGFGSYVLLRLLAARIYSDSVLEHVRAGDMTSLRVVGIERAMLDRASAHEPGSAPSPVIAYTKKTLRPAWRGAVLFVTLVVWFSFVSQIYVREFLVYHPVRGFMNQPLVQLPWFRYVPDALERAVQEPAERLRR